LILENEMSSVFPVSQRARLFNQLPHARERILLALFVALVENDHGNVMHLPPTHAESGKDIETPFCADALA